MNYEYMKEYPCNGEKPDLPDDVLVEARSVLTSEWYKTENKVGLWTWLAIDKFRICDERYKPEHHIPDAGKKIKSDWFEAGELPPVGTECEYLDRHSKEWIKVKVKYESDWGVVIESLGVGEGVELFFNHTDAPKFRPLRTERDELIDRAKAEVPDHVDIIGNWSHTVKIIEILAEAGMLKKPEGEDE